MGLWHHVTGIDCGLQAIELVRKKPRGSWIAVGDEVFKTCPGSVCPVSERCILMGGSSVAWISKDLDNNANDDYQQVSNCRGLDSLFRRERGMGCRACRLACMARSASAW
jgi:hypothetical protein